MGKSHMELHKTRQSSSSVQSISTSLAARSSASLDSGVIRAETLFLHLFSHLYSYHNLPFTVVDHLTKLHRQRKWVG